MYNLIDLFCGAGGMSLGFEMAGFESEMAIDMWESAIKTYNYNRKKNVGMTKDIYDISDIELSEFSQKKKILGIIGGPPCQGFSMVGTRDHTDKRNSLYLQYARFVQIVKPAFFVLENVKGLLNLNKGYFKKEIIQRFDQLGYNVNFQVLKASEFGVPQNRERVFFIGLNKTIFNDEFFDFPQADKVNFISTYEALSDLPSLENDGNSNEYSKKPQNEYQKYLRKNTNKIIYNNEITLHTEQTKLIISKVPDGGDARNLPDELYKVRNYNSAFKRMNSKLPSTTIDCGHRNYFHYKENRIPTVRESARIQSFPDDYIFLGTKTSQYTQVGNAVPPLLSRAIALKIMKYLKKYNVGD